MADQDAERLVGADRVLALLIELSRHPEGATLEELAGALAGSKSTIHRALGALVRSRLAEQTGRGRYVLGDELVRIAMQYHADRPATARLEPGLREAAERFGETVHYAILDGGDVVYRSKVDPPSGAVRLSSVVGGRNSATTTAVGKLLLALRLRSRAELDAWLAEHPLEARTERSLVDPDAFAEELRITRERGYGLDDQENEVGVNCLAVPVYLDGGTQPSGALSVSAIAFRRPLAELVARRRELTDILARLLGSGSAPA